jgi:hypothetical protein
MPSRIINGISVIFNSRQQDTAELICDTVDQSLQLIQESWGLGKPDDCRIYVMTTWWGFLFQSAPWSWRILLAITFPFWCTRVQRTWPYSAAWTQRFGHRVAIGIKPPHLLEVSDKSIGMRMFVEEQDTQIKVRHLTCHEMTHASSAHLKLPAWLNEGLAAVTVDRFLEKRTIRTDTLALLRSYKPLGKPPTYRELSRMDAEAIAYYAVLGYWLVQYLEEVHPGFLKRLFSSSPVSKLYENEISVQVGVESEVFWNRIPDMIFTHFKRI